MALKEEGQPIEQDWPYLDVVPADLNAYFPPQKVTVFRRNGERRPEAIDEIIGHLQAKTPCLIVMMISDAFYVPNAEGVIEAVPSEDPDPTRRHAVVAVGHGHVNGVRAVLIRNSWGLDWGIAGHAWLPEPFIEPRLTRIALLTEEINVPTQNLAA